MNEWDWRVSSAAREIERYLGTHPEASDSLQGIASWWVVRQRIRSEIAVVSAALEQLIDAGVVTAAQGRDEQGPRYRLKEWRRQALPER